MQPIVINYPKWKFWRWSLGGKNPLGWQRLLDQPRYNGKTIEVQGHNKPGDAAGGLYQYVEDYTGQHGLDAYVWVAPDEEGR